MKKILFSIFSFISLHSFGQSILITPEIIDKKHTFFSDDIKMTKYEDSPTIIGIRANGTVASPQKVKIGNELLFIGGRGFNGLTADGSSSSIRFFSTQDWMPNFKGSAIIFETTANNSKDRVDRMIINHDGKVGIGLTSPNQILDINGRMRIRHTIISDVDYSAGVWMSNSTNSLNDADGAFHGMKTNSETGFFIGGAWRFWVNSAGNGYLNGNLIQTSDQRLKKNLLPIKNSLSSIYKLNGYKFNWIEEARSRDLQTGLIAQEVQKIFPELVQTDEKGFLSVNYIGLVPHLIEAVKELRDENNSLKTNNQTLESRLDKIEAMLSTIQPNTENSNSKK